MVGRLVDVMSLKSAVHFLSRLSLVNPDLSKYIELVGYQDAETRQYHRTLIETSSKSFNITWLLLTEMMHLFTDHSRNAAPNIRLDKESYRKHYVVHYTDQEDKKGAVITLMEDK